uniref:Myosin IXA n=1 Tax=Cyclopterus lumpus TaxID=8103 RepID=A0A8C2X2L1_CYCLU
MGPAAMRRRLEDQEFALRVYPGALAEGTIYCPVSARKNTTAAEAIECLIERLRLDRTKCYVLAEVKEFGGEEWILNPGDCPVQRMMLWPRSALENRSGLGSGDDYRFLLREKNLDGSIHYGGSLQMWLRVTEERRRMVERGFLPQPAGSDPPSDLCALPELTERTILESLRAHFRQEKIYTYIGSILIVINPFQFLPIYNPKYVKLYDNHTLGKLEPHIYAVADVAYHAMLQRRKNQCIVISGESGSGKTQSTNFLIHHLTALSQKGFASGVEQIILGAGPVLEAFGNAKTAHNNNSSRFGKFIQVNYQESGTVRGAYVEKYLLEKSRLVYQEHNERNYHVFYYLLAGASEEERKSFHLLKPEEYHYLNQDCFTVEGEDLKHDFERLQLAMEMVGFLPATRKRIFSLLSAILHLGNIRYKKKTYRDDSIDICNPEVLPIVSELLEVKEEVLLEALTTRKTVTVGERLIVPYKLAEAGTVRDSMAKSLYSALFDWIVFRTNHALLNNKDLEDNSKILSIGVLDIFGFEDYENNSFEQFCINFANERLQHYFNQHIFKLEQEEYRAEGIIWHNIEYIDNSGCLNLISKKPTALFHLLDEECNFPQASNQTLLDKFKRQHEGNSYIEFPAVMESAFIIRHYAGKVKYGVKDFREKNTDHMRPDIVALLKSSKNAFVCSLMGIDPVATFRWAVLRAYFRALVAFREAGRRHTHKKTGEGKKKKKSIFSPPRCSDETRKNLTPKTHLNREKIMIIISIIIIITSRNENNKYKYTHLLDVKSLRYLSSVTLHDRITKSLLHLHKKKKPPSISAQFQASLNKLMETLDQSEPYFVKCFRSNAEKLPLRFNDGLVLRQLRYTGMLETVRIRQSGYSIKYTFQDFVRHFHVLLPRGTSPTKSGIREFFRRIHLPPAGYQVGNTTVFLREVERQRLQTLLHQEVLRRIVALQRRFRAVLERKRFVDMRRAAVCLQAAWRSFRDRCRRRCAAAVTVQAAWRGFWERSRYCRTHGAVTRLQAMARGHLVEEHNGHIFKSTQYSIPTYCEYCSSLIWMMDRACVCKREDASLYDPELSSRQYGVELSRLTSEERTVPQLVEKLINYIEMHGLYTEGIYRKSGSTNKIKELRQGLDTDVSIVSLDDYNIHVIASVLKQWLRDLPSPLMTFELYEEFLRAMGELTVSLHPPPTLTHLSTLERLIFHLVRIALQEETNRMSSNALAIVFAPCILRCPDTIDPLQSVQDISKTTACVELIINEQMGKYKARLKDINSLEFAESKAKSRLTLVRKSMVRPGLLDIDPGCVSSPVAKYSRSSDLWRRCATSYEDTSTRKENHCVVCVSGKTFIGKIQTTYSRASRFFFSADQLHLNFASTSRSSESTKVLLTTSTKRGPYLYIITGAINVFTVI